MNRIRKAIASGAVAVATLGVGMVVGEDVQAIEGPVSDCQTSSNGGLTLTTNCYVQPSWYFRTGVKCQNGTTAYGPWRGGYGGRFSSSATCVSGLVKGTNFIQQTQYF